VINLWDLDEEKLEYEANVGIAMIMDERKIKMEPKDYIVSKIDGDYAYLTRTDREEPEDKCVARALLPENVREGSKLRYEMLSYEIV
jgi:hypothetical protein